MPQGIFELENGGGLFGRVNIFSDSSNNLVFSQHGSSGAEQPRPSGTLKARSTLPGTLCSELKMLLGIYATSRHIPGVRFAGVSHPGLIGTAPSHELLATWNKREVGLIEAHANAVPPVAFGPLATGAYVGQELPLDVRERVYRDGARTIPGREHGGNCDVSGPMRVALYAWLIIRV